MNWRSVNSHLISKYFYRYYGQCRRNAYAPYTYNGHFPYGLHGFRYNSYGVPATPTPVYRVGEPKTVLIPSERIPLDSPK